MRPYDVVVVGSGIGGSVAAAHLATRGLRVCVLEKNASVGGVLASIERDGYTIDVGSHLVSRGSRGPVGRVLRELGLEEPRLLTHRIPLRSRGLFDLAAPPTRGGLFRVALHAVRMLEIPTRERLRLARMLFQIFTLTEGELERLDDVTFDAFLHRHSTHVAAYFLFGFLASIFFVVPPWEASAGEAIRCLRWLLRDYSLSYVKGGMHALCRALLDVVRRAGGDVVTRHRVHSIANIGQRFIVTDVNGDRREARAVVCNLAPRDVLDVVEGLRSYSEWVERVSAIRAAGSAHQVIAVLHRPLIEEGCLIGGISLEGRTLRDLTVHSMESMVASIRAGRISDPLAIYAPVPTNYDPSLAPNGEQIVVASVFAGAHTAGGDPPEAWRARTLDALASVVPGFRDALAFTDFRSVSDVGGWMGKSSHGAISNAQIPGQVGKARLGVRTPMRGLYIAGDGAGGRGIGIELATESGALAARAVLEDLAS